MRKANSAKWFWCTYKKTPKNIHTHTHINSQAHTHTHTLTHKHYQTYDRPVELNLLTNEFNGFALFSCVLLMLSLCIVLTILFSLVLFILFIWYLVVNRNCVIDYRKMFCLKFELCNFVSTEWNERARTHTYARTYKNTHAYSPYTLIKVKSDSTEVNSLIWCKNLCVFACECVCVFNFVWLPLCACACDSVACVYAILWAQWRGPIYFFLSNSNEATEIKIN